MNDFSHPDEGDPNRLESSYGVAARQIEEGYEHAGKWYGLFELHEGGAVFLSDDVFDTEEQATVWALEAGKAMIMSSLASALKNLWNDTDD